MDRRHSKEPYPSGDRRNYQGAEVTYEEWEKRCVPRNVPADFRVAMESANRALFESWVKGRPELPGSGAGTDTKKRTPTRAELKAFAGQLSKKFGQEGQTLFQQAFGEDMEVDDEETEDDTKAKRTRFAPNVEAKKGDGEAGTASPSASGASTDGLSETERRELQQAFKVLGMQNIDWGALDEKGAVLSVENFIKDPNEDHKRALEKVVEQRAKRTKKVEDA